MSGIGVYGLGTMGSIGVEVSSDLDDLIAGMRLRMNSSNSNHMLEDFIASNIRRAKAELSSTQTNRTQKNQSLLKLLYLRMLGYDVSWCHFHILESMTFPSLQLKRPGFLCCAVMLSENSEVSVLATNLFKKELQQHSLEASSQGLALTALANMVTGVMAANLSSDVSRLLSSSCKASHRRKAILCLLQIVLKHPPALLECLPKLRDMLNDPEEAVVAATLSTLLELATRNPSNYVGLAPVLFNIFSRNDSQRRVIRPPEPPLVSAPASSQHSLSQPKPPPPLPRSAKPLPPTGPPPSNFVMLKLLRLFALITPLESRLAPKLAPQLGLLLTNSSTCRFLQLEVIRLITAAYPPTSVLTQEALRVLRQEFWVSLDLNLKSLAYQLVAKLSSPSLPGELGRVHRPIEMQEAIIQAFATSSLSLVSGSIKQRLVARTATAIPTPGGAACTSNALLKEVLGNICAAEPMIQNAARQIIKNFVSRENFHYIRQSLLQAASTVPQSASRELQQLDGNVSTHENQQALELEFILSLGGMNNFLVIENFTAYIDFSIQWSLARPTLSHNAVALLTDQLARLAAQIPTLRPYIVRALAFLLVCDGLPYWYLLLESSDGIPRKQPPHGRPSLPHALLETAIQIITTYSSSLSAPLMGSNEKVSLQRIYELCGRTLWRNNNNSSSSNYIVQPIPLLDIVPGGESEMIDPGPPTDQTTAALLGQYAQVPEGGDCTPFAAQSMALLSLNQSLPSYTRALAILVSFELYQRLFQNPSEVPDLIPHPSVAAPTTRASIAVNMQRAFSLLTRNSESWCNLTASVLTAVDGALSGASDDKRASTPVALDVATESGDVIKAGEAALTTSFSAIFQARNCAGVFKCGLRNEFLLDAALEGPMLTGDSRHSVPDVGATQRSNDPMPSRELQEQQQHDSVAAAPAVTVPNQCCKHALEPDWRGSTWQCVFESSHLRIYALVISRQLRNTWKSEFPNSATSSAGGSIVEIGVNFCCEVPKDTERSSVEMVKAVKIATRPIGWSKQLPEGGLGSDPATEPSFLLAAELRSRSRRVHSHLGAIREEALAALAADGSTASADELFMPQFRVAYEVVERSPSSPVPSSATAEGADESPAAVPKLISGLAGLRVPCVFVLRPQFVSRSDHPLAFVRRISHRLRSRFSSYGSFAIPNCLVAATAATSDSDMVGPLEVARRYVRDVAGLSNGLPVWTQGPDKPGSISVLLISSVWSAAAEIIAGLQPHTETAGATSSAVPDSTFEPAPVVTVLRCWVERSEGGAEPEDWLCKCKVLTQSTSLAICRCMVQSTLQLMEKLAAGDIIGLKNDDAAVAPSASAVLP